MQASGTQPSWLEGDDRAHSGVFSARSLRQTQCREPKANPVLTPPGTSVIPSPHHKDPAAAEKGGDGKGPGGHRNHGFTLPLMGLSHGSSGSALRDP